MKDKAPPRTGLPTQKPANLTVALRIPSSKGLSVSYCVLQLGSNHLPSGGKEEIKCPALMSITSRFVRRLCHSHHTQDSLVCICPVKPTRHHRAALGEENSAP